jgi:all-trans-retinol 13,14-reductase
MEGSSIGSQEDEMLVGTRYGTRAIDARYDTIVIGSGLSGLTTAAVLAKAGKKVLVLERHYTAGGFTHSFRRRGFEWDVGVHYVGEVHKPDSLLRRAFDSITDGELQWARMDDPYDRIVIGEDAYDFVAGARRFREELLRSFPHAGDQIDEYLRLIRAASASMPAHFAPRYLPRPLQPLAASVASRAAGSYFTRTTRSVMSDAVSDPRLAAVLTGQWGDYGLPPGQSSFGMHAIVAQHYLGGASFPVGGAWRIADTIVPVIERSGGAVLVDAEVASIIIAHDRASGVRMANGDEISSDNVVSAAGLRTTYGRLVPEDVASRLAVTNKVASVRPAVGHIGLYIGLRATARDLDLAQTNLWIYREDDHDRSLARYLAAPSTDVPLTYISFPSAKDPSWETRYPGKATIDVISLAPYEWFEPWKGEPWRKRGAEYDDVKAQLSERLLADVYRHVPQIRGHVAYHELSTPLSTAEFGNYSRGEVYGLEHSPHRFAQRWITPRAPIRGLFLTGQDILFCGVGSAMMSGIVTATSMLGPRAARVLPEVLGWPRQLATR